MRFVRLGGLNIACFMGYRKPTGFYCVPTDGAKDAEPQKPLLLADVSVVATADSRRHGPSGKHLRATRAGLPKDAVSMEGLPTDDLLLRLASSDTAPQRDANQAFADRVLAERRLRSVSLDDWVDHLPPDQFRLEFDHEHQCFRVQPNRRPTRTDELLALIVGSVRKIGGDETTLEFQVEDASTVHPGEILRTWDYTVSSGGRTITDKKLAAVRILRPGMVVRVVARNYWGTVTHTYQFDGRRLHNSIDALDRNSRHARIEAVADLLFDDEALTQEPVGV